MLRLPQGLSAGVCFLLGAEPSKHLRIRCEQIWISLPFLCSVTENKGMNTNEKY